MAQLNFPDPNSTQVYEAGGLKWTWNDTHQVWSAEMGSDNYLSSTEDDTASGAITFAAQTTHESGIRVLGGQVRSNQGGILSFLTSGTANVNVAPGVATLTDYTGYSSGGNASATVDGTLKGYEVLGTLQGTPGTRTGTYGFYSAVTAETNAYNFYAAGDAPNYFAGDVLQGNKSTGSLDPGDNAMRMQNGVLRVCCSSNEKGRSAVSLLRAYSHQGVYIAFSSAATGDTDFGSAAASIRLEGQGNVITDNITNTFRVSRTAAAPAQITDAVETIKALSPGLTSFAAEDLIDNAPSVVIADHADEDYILVDQTKLIPILTKALQDALGEIDNLKERLAALEGA